MTQEEKQLLLSKAVDWLIFETETLHFSDGSERRCLKRPLEESIKNFRNYINNKV